MLHTYKLIAMQPTQQQLVDYTNAMVKVNGYAYAIYCQKLPTLLDPPSDYAKFIDIFVPAKRHVEEWVNTIFIDLIAIPKSIVESGGDLFDLQSTFIETYLSTLISDPTNEKAKTGLMQAFERLKKIVNTQIDSVTKAEERLNQFSINIESDAPTLVSIAQKALDAVDADKSKIDNINSDIAQVRESIKNAETLLTISEISIGVTIFLGLVGLVLVFVPGGQKVGAVLLVGAVVGLGGAIAGTVIESLRIKELQQQILHLQEEISNLGNDIILLNGVADQFKQLHEANIQAQDALKTIKNLWFQMEIVIKEFSTALTSTDSDITSVQYGQALNDFKMAEDNWKSVVAFAKSLTTINYNWQDSSGKWHIYDETDMPKKNNIKVLPIDPSRADTLISEVTA